MRVVVVGSPSIRDPRQVRHAMKECLHTAESLGSWLNLTTGGYRSGPDDIAYRWAFERWKRSEHVARPVTVSPRYRDDCRTECKEGHRRPDRWSPGETICPSAPFYRNETLAASDADMFLVWIVDKYQPAVHMWELVEALGRCGTVFRS